MAVLYRQFRPSPALRAFVERLWLLEGPADAIGTDPIPPDGRPEIIVHGGDPYAERARDGSLHVQARVLFAGQLTRAMQIMPRGFARIAGAQQRPHGAYDLLRVAQHPFTDRVVDVRSIDRPTRRISSTTSRRSSAARPAIGTSATTASRRSSVRYADHGFQPERKNIADLTDSRGLDAPESA